MCPFSFQFYRFVFLFSCIYSYLYIIYIENLSFIMYSFNFFSGWGLNPTLNIVFNGLTNILLEIFLEQEVIKDAL